MPDYGPIMPPIRSDGLEKGQVMKTGSRLPAVQLVITGSETSCQAALDDLYAFKREPQELSRTSDPFGLVVRVDGISEAEIAELQMKYGVRITCKTARPQ